MKIAGKNIFPLILFLLLMSGYSYFSFSSTPSKLDQSAARAIAALKGKNWLEAQQLLTKCVALQEKNHDISFEIMRVLASRGQVQVTKESLEKGKEDSNIDGYYLAMTSNQAMCEILCFTAQMNCDGKTADEYFIKVLGQKGLMWGESWIKTISLVNKCFPDLFPEEKSLAWKKTCIYAGMFLTEAGMTQEARELYEEGKEPLLSNEITSNRIETLIDLSTACWLLDNSDSTIKYAQKAVRIEPLMPGPHGTMALAYIETGEFAKAIEEAEKGAKLSNNHKYFQTILATALWAKGDTQKAIDLVAKTYKSEALDLDFMKKWFFKGKSLEALEKLKVASMK